MYIPKSFVMDEAGAIQSFIYENSFATLITHGESGLQASHLPFEFEAENNKLISHLARANPQWRDFGNGEVLVAFTGPHGYISPSWYETELAVPTWNYVAVHVYGTATVLEDDSAVAGLLERLVARYEAGMPNPWRLEAPEAWQANMRKALVGFEITIARVEAKAKLSQNRPAADIVGAIAGLVGQGNAELAAMMWGVNGPKLDAAKVGGKA